MLSPEIIAGLKNADKRSYAPRPREFLRSAPKRALLIIVDGITPEALARSQTPTFDALTARGVSATDARSIFPTITGPAHTSMLTGARVGTHGFLYPKMLDAYGNRLLDFTEGLMQAETLAEAARPRGIVSVGIGSRFLRGADVMMTEGALGEDYEEIAARAVGAVHDWTPHFLMVVFYAADSMGHLFGPEAPETLAAIETIDAMTARILDAYAAHNLLDELCVAVVADHGMLLTETVVGTDFGERVGALAHGRLALIPNVLSESDEKALLDDPRVETIFDRPDLEILGAWGPRWGEQVVLLKEGFMFPYRRPLRGYHGAWSRTEQHVPLILSGAGIRSGALVGTCEIIDLAPTLAVLIGSRVPGQSQGRVLWEALDMEDAPEINTHTHLLLRRDELSLWTKMLKKAYALSTISRKEFLDQRMELWRAAELNSKEIRRESEKLSQGIVHD